MEDVFLACQGLTYVYRRVPGNGLCMSINIPCGVMTRPVYVAYTHLLSCIHACVGLPTHVLDFFWKLQEAFGSTDKMQGACHVHVPLSVDACPRVFLFSFLEIAGRLGSNQCGGYPYANLGLVPPLTHCTHTALCHEAIRGRTLPRCWHMGDVAG